MSLVQTASSLPIVLLALPAGAWADLVDRRRLLLGAQVAMFRRRGGAGRSDLPRRDLARADPRPDLRAGLRQRRSPAPAWQAIQPDLVDRALLPQAAALNGLNMNVARAVGPAIGGFVVAAVGAGLGVRAQRGVVRRHRGRGGLLARARARRDGAAASGWSRRCGPAGATCGTR